MARGAIKCVSINGALTVTFTAASGATPAVFSDEACTTTISLPATVADGANTTFYFASPGSYTLSVKTSGGIQIAGDLNSTKVVTVAAGDVGVYAYDTRLVARDASGDSGRHSPNTDLSAAYKPWSVDPVNVKDPTYGALGDGRRVTDAAITTGTATLTSATAAFTSADVGKRVSITGAGAAGAAFTTTISGYTNATTVTLAANAGTSVGASELYVGTDDTAALQAAITAACAAGRACFLPPGTYMLSAALTTNRRGFRLLGGNRSVTELHQCSPTADGITVGNSTDADPVVSSSVPSEMAFEGFGITGPGSGTVSSSTGKGINISPNVGWNGSMCRFDVRISGFAYGLYGDGMQDTSGEVLASANDVGVYLRGQAAFNNNNHLTISTSRSGTVGLIVDVGVGSVIKCKDMINQPLAIRVLNNAQVSLQGGDFESVTGAGDCWIDVQAGANVNHYGPCGFTKSVGNALVNGWKVAGGAILNVYGNIAWDGTLTGQAVKKTNNGAVVKWHGTSTNTTLRVDDNTATTYPPSPRDVVADNAVPSGSANYRHVMLDVASRDSAGAHDRKVWIWKDGAGNYTTLDIPWFIIGTGDPNGVVTAYKGVLYIDSNASGTGGATLWAKETSGRGNTGWVMVGGRPAMAVKTAGYTLTTLDQTIVVNAAGATNQVLPNPSSALIGKVWTISNIGAGTVTVVPSSGAITGVGATDTVTTGQVKRYMTYDGAAWCLT